MSQPTISSYDIIFICYWNGTERFHGGDGNLGPISAASDLWDGFSLYLGVVLKYGPRFVCSVTDRVKSFYRSLNSILRIEGRSDDTVLLQLIETHCVPILTYAIETVVIANRDERRSLRVAYNSVFRKLFGYRQYESVTNLQHALNRCTWEELVEERKIGFLRVDLSREQISPEPSGGLMR